MIIILILIDCAIGTLTTSRQRVATVLPIAHPSPQIAALVLQRKKVALARKVDKSHVTYFLPL